MDIHVTSDRKRNKNQAKNIQNKMLQLTKTNKHKIQTNKKQTQQNETKIDCHYTPT